MASDQARLATVSASYGAGGSVVGPALAAGLGVPFLSRATTSSGGTTGLVPCAERLVPDEANMTPAHRLLAPPQHREPARADPVPPAGPARGSEPAPPVRGRHPPPGGRRRGRDPWPGRGRGARQ